MIKQGFSSSHISVRVTNSVAMIFNCNAKNEDVPGSIMVILTLINPTQVSPSNAA
jgi:hypothetical protein